MVSPKDTLIIKHLPPELSDADKEELFKHFGAKDVKCITSKIKKYNVVFAKFQNEQTADHVLRRLHQLKINGVRLSVEFTKDKESVFPSQEQSLKEFENKEEIENEKCYKRFIEKLNLWHCNSLNFKQPVPNHLKYQYPPPNNVVLLNIVKALATVPKFYTQVLHLMNKMNLPCPFERDILPDFNIQLLSFTNQTEGLVDAEIGVTETENEQNMEAQPESSESEISSDDEVKKQKETIPDQVKVRKRKVMNLPRFVKPMTATLQYGVSKQKKTSISEVFEKLCDEKEVKKIKLSYPSEDVIIRETASAPHEQVTDQDDQNQSSGFGFLHPVNKPPSPPPKVDVRDEREEERLEKPEIHCITINELNENRIPEKDQSVLPVFRNYAEGAPTNRLYIKNLAKTVTEDDLRYIYNRYLPAEPGEPYLMDIRLMQEGRMKGQAFVTFYNVQLAQTALKETNGYILKDKPLVVQFARSATKS